MNEKNISKNVLNKIKEEEITPKPKWRFLLKDCILWIVFGLNILLGSVFFVISLFYVLNNDWDVYKYLDKNLLEHIIASMPYLRIFALGTFVLLAYYNYRHTDKGYKYKTFRIIGMSVSIIFLIGATIFLIGADSKIEKIFSKNLPYYNSVEEHKTQMWTQPDKGLLSGEIVGVGDNTLIIVDNQSKNWQIDTKKTMWRGPVKNLKTGIKIKIIGKQVSDSKFEAKEIRPWSGRMRGHNIK